MYRSNLSLMAWFYALLLFANTSIGIRAAFIRKQLGIGHKSSHRLCKMIRVHMATMARPGMMGGDGNPVHIDEVFLRYIVNSKGGPNGAVIVLGFASEGQVISKIIPSRKSQVLTSRIFANVMPKSKIMTDMWLGYNSLCQYDYEHIRINHSVALHDFRGNTTNYIEAYWSTVRRMLKSARQVTRANMWMYLAEIEFKYNRRNRKGTIFEELISNFADYDFDNLAIIRKNFDCGDQS